MRPVEYIKREDAIAAAKHAWAKGLEPSQYIEMIDAADVRENLRGNWIEEDGYQVCPFCGEEHTWDTYRANYCDACGADLRGT